MGSSLTIQPPYKNFCDHLRNSFEPVPTPEFGLRFVVVHTNMNHILKATYEAADCCEDMTIVVAGASGYVGRALLLPLIERFPDAQIIALSRSRQPDVHPHVVWHPCDLFSLQSIENALPASIDLAFYLVHSMGPTAQLDQGSFADYDLILADNFAKAVREKNAGHLIYLGGLMPDTEKMSLHLQSRREIEDVFMEHHLPTTVFRAGLVLGEGGSSFQILIKLVNRLPVMLCPAWTQTKTTPVDLPTVIKALVNASQDSNCVGQVYDLAGCSPLTYLEMMKETARRLGLKRIFLAVPFFTPTLSRLWVTLITNTPKDLVYPLVESLEHTMVARPSHRFGEDRSNQSYYDLLKNISMSSGPKKPFFRFRVRRNTVRSVQRMQLPKGQDAAFVKQAYFNWLRDFTSGLIRVESSGKNVTLRLFGNLITLIELSFDSKHSNRHHQILLISGGALVSRRNRGRFEMRTLTGQNIVLLAIHDYKPSLPWFVYKFTQALVHLFVMRKFAKQLAEISSQPKI